MRVLVMLLAFCFSISVFAQEKTNQIEKKKPTEADKIAQFDANGVIKRGAPISKSAKKVALEDVLKEPAKYQDQTLLVEGVIVRSCKKEGCWAELAPAANKPSIRVKMKDHAFFIPLQSEGLLAKVEGKVILKTLSKEQVKHMIEEDGAKFEKINPDGTVTEVTFEASGIELRKPKKRVAKASR
ncbi:MAG: hypothetical protein KatS3mg006_0593 [Pyrinomonadaceae bacterium]|jgi:hypothetical protein|nr:MAG: hypothetical protein KatS3mg006_0593 [Pyrinomonadaceae bacterium]